MAPYRIGGEFAYVNQMELQGSINNFTTLELDSDLEIVKGPFPWIEIQLKQVPPTDPLHTFTLYLIATPWPRIAFSTDSGFTSLANKFQTVSDGDLLNTFGEIVFTNHQLTSRLGIMPIAPDIGLDAIAEINSNSNGETKNELWFSSEVDIFSELIGPLHHSDLLSKRGYIARNNSDLIIPFSPMPPLIDYGLDAVSMGLESKIVFSTETDFFSENLGRTITHEDLLAENGQIVKTHDQLIAEFQPADINPKKYWS